MSNPLWIALGHNNPAGFFKLSPQPHVLGPLETARDYAPTGQFVSQGTYAKLVYSALSEIDEASVLAQLGLSRDVPFADVTIGLPSDDRRITVLNWNGTVTLPQHEVDDKHSLNMFTSVVFIVAGLTQF